MKGGKFCPECGKPLKKLGLKDTIKINDKKIGIKKEPEEKNKTEIDEPFSHEIMSQEKINPQIVVSFYESMPDRFSFNNTNSYIKGILEITDNGIIIHKKSFWRGKDRGKKHIHYDKITSVDYDSGKLLAPPSIQLYL
ncbi:MAG: hypothetical protein K8E24_005250 [Methanobacterium paludis]|nr:hypothetical protein [Methanobacterium paludis]